VQEASEDSFPRAIRFLDGAQFNEARFLNAVCKPANRRERRA